MPGTLIPPWYQSSEPTIDDLIIVSTTWGISLGLSGFGIFRVANQTRNQYRRKKKVTWYMALIWLELIVSTVFGGVGWGFIMGKIPPSFEFYFGIVILWIFQVHCIVQIIINRVALLAVSPVTVRRLRWGVFSIMVLINIAVSCIWIPARLQINQRWIVINNIFDRGQKLMFLFLDGGLNCYFVYLVRSSLIQYGLSKYVFLYRFNIAMIFLSISMDALIFGMMFIPDTFVYVIFHSLAYLVKLHIELGMSNLIAKIVRNTGNQVTCDCACHINNPFPFGRDLNLTNHSTPAVFHRAPHDSGHKRHIREYSWRRTMRFFSVQEDRWVGEKDEKKGIGDQRSSVSTVVAPVAPKRPAPVERAFSWAGPVPPPKDSALWLSSFTSTIESDHEKEDSIDVESQKRGLHDTRRKHGDFPDKNP
ncbi:hypothetical protein EDB81DRAFT_663574 [Dactylonectria macrodidyma]|uniref:Uncharacterized protein n=1 Tax=Dactylonectria macrodidyma TaxID=307937 RepID=A0A9P9DVU6_9HYPO|nr:hypothetical protein EDB81DRAFT_663574 [Dactylonectria macrodidyma]